LTLAILKGKKKIKITLIIEIPREIHELNRFLFRTTKTIETIILAINTIMARHRGINPKIKYLLIKKSEYQKHKKFKAKANVAKNTP